MSFSTIFSYSILVRELWMDESRTDRFMLSRETLLGSTELQLETRSVQVGYWARVNGVLLSGPHGLKVRLLLDCRRSILTAVLGSRYHSMHSINYSSTFKPFTLLFAHQRSTAPSPSYLNTTARHSCLRRNSCTPNAQSSSKFRNRISCCS